MSPDGSTKPPPEETLLRLIRGKGPRADAPDPAVVVGTLASAVASVGLAGRARSIPWPRVAIGCLSLGVLIEIVSLLVEVMRPLPAVHVPVVTPPPAPPSASAAAPASAIPSLEASLSHPIFTPSVAAGPAVPPTARTGPSGSAKQLASRLTLTGIVSGAPGEAVIEDSETKKTYFVTTGQVVVEGATLERVLDNRVILDLDGEKIELSL